MPEYNMEWARCIRELLEKHSLTIRGAADYVRGAVSYSYVAHWVKGQTPEYRTAIAFLKHFPREDAVPCLRAAGFPVPEEWSEQSAPVDTTALAEDPDLRPVIEHLAGEPHPPTETREQMIERAFRFVSEDPDVKVGSAAMARHPIEAKLSLIRLYERHTGRKLLPDDVI